MSDCKELILDGTIMDKIEEIKKDLTVEIREEKHKEKLDKGYEWGKSYPYECLLEEVEHLLIKYRRSYVYGCYCMNVDDMETYSVEQHLKDYYPSWKDIFNQTKIEKLEELYGKRYKEEEIERERYG